MSSAWKPPEQYASTAMEGGASNRSYERIAAGEDTWVVMVLAEEPIRSEEASSGPVATELPFLEIQRFLAAGGVSVPQIHHFDQERGRLWLDDLGDVRLFDTLEAGGPASWIDAYKPAIDVLLDFQTATAGERQTPICYQRAFEPALLRWELDHYIEWRVEAQLQRKVSEPARFVLDDAFDDLVSQITSQPQILCHRDFQSTNLMDVTNRGLVLIDFQDALKGSYSYDLVSLLRDSYIPLSMAQVDALVGYYLSRRPDLDAAAFQRDFLLQAVQRKLKDAGRFVYIDRVKGNPAYLKFIDDSLRYVRDALERLPQLKALRGLLADLDPAAFA